MNIVFESENTWVLQQQDRYSVFIKTITHSESTEHYELTNDGLSIAIARAKYLNSRKQNEETRT